MPRLREIPISSRDPARFARVCEAAQAAALAARGPPLARRLAGRTAWHVSSTARGGGVAEMLQALLGYVRGSGVDARWLVIGAPPEFFRVTKRLHHALHGAPGDGSALGAAERALYEDALRHDALEMDALVRAGDLVVLHDPQTAGLTAHLARRGALVVWRCHIGCDAENGETERGWSFLAPYLEGARVQVYSRAAFVPASCPPQRAMVIPPSIDPFTPKNHDLDERSCRAILVHVGLVEGPAGDAAPAFIRDDGSPARVDRGADVQRLGRAPRWSDPLVVQVSRWDRLKDPDGVLRGFERLLDAESDTPPELVLAGPNVHAVSDDPEGAAVYGEVVAAWRALPHSVRRRVHLASLPMADVEENAAIVNALQRHAAVVVQKSLQEGFGLTVTEALWKARPVLASAVGGIQDQIEHGVHGLLLKDPRDPDAFARELGALLRDRRSAERLGRNGRRRVAEQYLGIHTLLRYADLVERVDGG